MEDLIEVLIDGKVWFCNPESGLCYEDSTGGFPMFTLEKLPEPSEDEDGNLVYIFNTECRD